MSGGLLVLDLRLLREVRSTTSMLQKLLVRVIAAIDRFGDIVVSTNYWREFRIGSKFLECIDHPLRADDRCDVVICSVEGPRRRSLYLRSLA